MSFCFSAKISALRSSADFFAVYVRSSSFVTWSERLFSWTLPPTQRRPYSDDWELVSALAKHSRISWVQLSSYALRFLWFFSVWLAPFCRRISHIERLLFSDAKWSAVLKSLSYMSIRVTPPVTARIRTLSKLFEITAACRAVLR